jgi:hypothetical protein
VEYAIATPETSTAAHATPGRARSAENGIRTLGKLLLVYRSKDGIPVGVLPTVGLTPAPSIDLNFLSGDLPAGITSGAEEHTC